MRRRAAAPQEPVDGLTSEQRDRLEVFAAAIPPGAIPKSPEVLALRAALLETMVALPSDSFVWSRLHQVHIRLRVDEDTVKWGVDALQRALGATE